MQEVLISQAKDREIRKLGQDREEQQQITEEIWQTNVNISLRRKIEELQQQLSQQI